MNDETNRDSKIRLPRGTLGADEIIQELEKKEPVVASTPTPEPAKEMTMDEIRALAVTVRTAMRTGHPSATEHLNNLLSVLGAV